MLAVRRAAQAPVHAHNRLWTLDDERLSAVSPADEVHATQAALADADQAQLAAWRKHAVLNVLPADSIQGRLDVADRWLAEGGHALGLQDTSA